MGNVDRLMDLAHSYGEGVVIPRSVLVENVWGYEDIASTNIAVLLNKARKEVAGDQQVFGISGVKAVVMLSEELLTNGYRLPVGGLLGMLAGVESDNRLIERYFDNGGEIDEVKMERVIDVASQVTMQARGGGVNAILYPQECVLLAKTILYGSSVSYQESDFLSISAFSVAVLGINRMLRSEELLVKMKNKQGSSYLYEL